MHPADIQAALKKRGINQTQIANELGVSKWAVSAVINKIIVSDRIMRIVAAKIELHPYDIFPEYYRGPLAQRFIDNPNK